MGKLNLKDYVFNLNNMENVMEIVIFYILLTEMNLIHGVQKMIYDLCFLFYNDKIYQIIIFLFIYYIFLPSPRQHIFYNIL